DEIKMQYPLSQEHTEAKKIFDKKVADIFKSESDKFLLIIGPCSADTPDSVMEYMYRLAKVQEQVKDKIVIIPRVYTNKPRTTGDGYKGMVHQPNPNEKPDMLKGIMAIRNLHTKVISETGFFCADEMLYPENYSYLSDILSYVAVGARSVENQQHRLVSSGMDVPVGMKNPTSGDYSVMLNSIVAATHSHTFIYNGWEVETAGNPLAHAILRGYVDKHGQSFPNYHYEDLIRLYDAYKEKEVDNIALIVDANHANSNKQYLEQVRICKEILHSCRHSNDIKNLVKGFMIESYLEDGAQKIGEGIFGKSITDPCLGWEKSEKLILDIADLL
ncbi:MAG: 3-deoxy-7-phosphoheptulonate synthase, partial [Clostridia bacterium]|nr:3-deoxy-7-phosphoheptulonate synthase [Clostridia bacterium]